MSTLPNPTQDLSMTPLPEGRELRPSPSRGVREIRVRNTFLSRVWATLTETIAHPFTPSVLILEDRPETPSDVDATPHN
jgi:hypothetical protein